MAKEIENIGGADARMADARSKRREAYRCVFQTLVDEEQVLRDLYAALGRRLETEGNVVSKLQFYVHRRVDVRAWVARGEALLDLRKKGPFQGQGTLSEIARSLLLGAWQKGSPDDVATAMDEFIRQGGLSKVESFFAHDTTMGAFVEWLFSTDHIHIEYGIRHDNVDLRNLSPGSRGIVLLILYLPIDQWDSRPLIVDQPEENLDPQSIFDDLVEYFRSARRRRQVIIVTHNANLVVNTDADQVIIASSQRAREHALPRFRYEAGALEEREIRERVCRILEGGERAFLKRERRYGLRL